MVNKKLFGFFAIDLILIGFYVSHCTGTSEPYVPESRIQKVLGNITESVRDISNKLKVMRGIAVNGTSETLPVLEEHVDKEIATYEELIKRVELARKKVKELQNTLNGIGKSIDRNFLNETEQEKM